MQLCSAWKEMNCIFQGRSTVSDLASFWSQQLDPITCLKSRRNWHNDSTGLGHALPLWSHSCAVYAARVGEEASIVTPPLWLKFLLSLGLIQLQGKFNSKSVSWIWTRFLKDFWVFVQASSSICFGGCCQTPESWVGRCCCFLLIALSK